MVFKKGNTIMLGRKLSAETRKKMSESHKKLKPSSWGAGFKKGNVPWNSPSAYNRNAYFAGFFDADGSVYITANTRQSDKYRKVGAGFSLRADKASPLKDGHKIWGGSLHTRPPRKHNHRHVLQWRLWTKSAEKFLKDIKPFLRLKKRQVEIALEYRHLQTRKRKNTFPYLTNQIPEKEHKYREKLEKELRRLNS